MPGSASIIQASNGNGGRDPPNAPAARLLSFGPDGVDIENAKVVACDQAAWRFLGLSFAGWNAVIVGRARSDRGLRRGAAPLTSSSRGER